jgi:chromosome partitioning protein
MGKIIAIASPKGGVGKTTTAVNLAAGIAVTEMKVLLIDLDTAGSAGISLGFSPQDRTPGVYEILKYTHSVRQCIHKTELEHLDFVPMNPLKPVDEERINRLSDNKMLLYQLLIPLKREYEYILLDCPPFIRGFMTAALAASDSVLIPAKVGHLSIEAVEKLFEHLAWLERFTNRPVAVEGIVQTMYEARTKSSSIFQRILIDKFNKIVLNTVIPKNTTLSECAHYGKPAILFDANSKGSIAYLALAQEIVRNNKYL